jgi:lipid A disaccharide synthetase
LREINRLLLKSILSIKKFSLINIIENTTSNREIDNKDYQSWEEIPKAKTSEYENNYKTPITEAINKTNSEATMSFKSP